VDRPDSIQMLIGYAYDDHALTSGRRHSSQLPLWQRVWLVLASRIVLLGVTAARLRRGRLRVEGGLGTGEADSPQRERLPVRERRTARRMNTTRFRRVAGTCAVAGPVVFSAAWLVAWAAQDTYSPRREDISALAALDAQQPWIMEIGFLALAVGLVALGMGLMRAVAGGRLARVGALLVLLAGLGILVAGIARNDCSSELLACKARIDAGNVSWHHGLHDAVSGVVFLALVVAQVVLARAFRCDSSWRDLRAYSIVSGLLTLALLVLFGSDAIDGWNGLIQRVFLAVPLVWIMVLGIRLRRLANDS
jgi:hypothetical membrane protein